MPTTYCTHINTDSRCNMERIRRSCKYSITLNDWAHPIPPTLSSRTFAKRLTLFLSGSNGWHGSTFVYLTMTVNGSWNLSFAPLIWCNAWPARERLPSITGNWTRQHHLYPHIYCSIRHIADADGWKWHRRIPWIRRWPNSHGANHCAPTKTSWSCLWLLCL